MSIPTEPRFLSVDDVAKRINASKSTIWRWAKERPDFPKPLELGPRTTRWKVSDLEAFEAALGGAQ